MKPANFICTVGPTNNSAERIERMIYKGLSVARLNLSHGSFEEHQNSIENCRLAAERCRERTTYYCPLAIAADIRGPEIRIGKTETTFVKIHDQIRLNENPYFGEQSSFAMIHVDYPLTGKLKKNAKIYIGDGSIGMKVEEIFGDVITCRVFKSGVIKSFQSVNIPELQDQLRFPLISERDKLALNFAAEQDLDFVFMSHVESGECIDAVRAFLGRPGKQIEVYAKIQNQKGVKNIEEIIAKSDGIVIDPTMDLDPYTFPLIQRMVLSLCSKKQKPCFLSAESELISTEVYQAFNWMMESADGIILKGEAAIGKFKPLESMATLTINRSIISDEFLSEEASSDEVCDVKTALASSCVTSSILTHASVIIVTADKMANFVYHAKPKCPMVVVTRHEKKCRQLNVYDNLIPLLWSTEAVNKLSKYDFAINFSKLRGILKCGETVVLLKKDSFEVHYIQYDE